MSLNIMKITCFSHGTNVYDRELETRVGPVICLKEAKVTGVILKSRRSECNFKRLQRRSL